MTYTILGKQVGDVGFGLMGLTTSPTPISDDVAFAAIKAALDAGCNYFNAGEFYGPPDANSLTLLNRYLARYPGDADRIVLNVKGGWIQEAGSEPTPAGTRDGIRASIDNVLRMLGPAGRVDQFEAARKDPNADYVKETLAAIDEYVKAGKVGGISCSEVNAKTLREAAQSFTITALEIELSLFETESLTNGLLETCAELNIPVIAYSPLGKGILGGKLKTADDVPKGDFRQLVPRYSPENFQKNLELVSALEALASRKGCTVGQLAINWLVSLSKRPGMPKIIPIPGSSKPDRIRENATILDLTEDDLAQINKVLAAHPIAGARYPDFVLRFSDA